MSTITFDSMNLVRELRQAGIEQNQAEAIVNAISTAQDGVVSTAHFDARMKENESQTRAMLAETKAEIIKWNVGAIIAAVGLAITAAKILH